MEKLKVDLTTHNGTPIGNLSIVTVKVEDDNIKIIDGGKVGIGCPSIPYELPPIKQTRK